MDYRKKLISKLDKMDEALEELFANLAKFNNEQLNKSPEEGVWSPIQLLNHMTLSEKLSLAYCRKKLSFDPKLKNKNLRSWFNARLITWSLASPFKFKAPAPVREGEFNANGSLQESEKLWKAIRKDLRQFLNEVPEKYIEKEVYKHPNGLRLSLEGMLDFLNQHFKRHRKQMYQRLPATQEI
ncbi:DinB family protein [Portibacter marinus]|uniref:DinB family protein n=1 Tax=Portibacter marinus TaxID=2898660 RepID=UPI001F367B65|nr:DinB family protein [Portibacter marinus]